MKRFIEGMTQTQLVEYNSCCSNEQYWLFIESLSQEEYSSYSENCDSEYSSEKEEEEFINQLIALQYEDTYELCKELVHDIIDELDFE
jgi:hypothetical protein